MKRFIAGVVIGLLLAVSIPASAQSVVRLFLDGKEIKSDVPPQIIKGTTMVPLRVIVESLGVNVEWDGKENKVIMSTGKVVSANAQWLAQFDKDIDSALKYVYDGMISNYTYSNPYISTRIFDSLSLDEDKLDELDLPLKERGSWSLKLLTASAMMVHYEFAVANKPVPKAFNQSRNAFLKSRDQLIDLLKD